MGLEGRGHELKESTVAVEVFSRRQDFDGRFDNCVRMNVSRLRSKLAEYYQKQGAQDPVRIEIPRGGYASRFACKPDDNAHPSLQSRTATRLLSAAAVLLIAALAFWLGSFHARRALPAELPPMVHSLYSRFWSAPTLLVYRNPTFLRVESEFPLLLLYGGNVHGGAYERIKLPADIPEALAQRYKDKTVTFESNWSDAGAVETAFGIARVFGRAGAPLTLQNTQHADAEQWRGHNLIVVSPPWYNQFVKQLPPLRRFEFAESEALVRMKGAGGKLEEFEPEFSPKGEGLRTTWAVVSLAPGFSHGTHFLRISGVHLPATQGAARFITSDEGLRELAQGLGDPSRLPEQFEVLLRVDTLRGQVTRVSFSRGADTTAR